MKFKKLWNNRIFRTFIEASLGSLFGFFAVNNILETNEKILISVVISAVSTGISAILPLLEEE